MPTKISRKRILVTLSIVGVLLLASLITLASRSNASKNLIVEKFIAPVTRIVGLDSLRPAMPVRLRISKINVDALVEYVGVTDGGALAVPKGPVNVGWFDLGPRPGEPGSAVIAGHYGWANNTPAVFDHLNELQVGDNLYIYDAKDEVTTFVVKSIRSYGENEDAADVFVSDDGLSHLNLITCEGVWSKDTKSYSKRLVVFADKI